MTFFFLRKKDRLAEEKVKMERAVEESVIPLREERDRLFAVLEGMVEGVVVVDADRNIRLINSVLAKVLGSKRSSLEGRYFWEIFRDPSINQMMEHALTGQVSTAGEHEPLFSKSVFSIQISPVFAGEKFLGIVAVFHDVTLLKELEHSRSEFVANVSHELKTPLTSILGFIETLKEGAIDDAENRMKFLQIIEDHSKKLHALIGDLLLLSKVESGAGFEKRSVDFGEAIRRVMTSFERAAKAKNLRVSLKISPTPFVLTAEAASLEEALCNLVDNAIRYSLPGGELAVRALYEGNEAKIEVRDTGIGIPQEEIPRIFERFYRVDKSRARDSGGTGLGLSIAKHIIERHKGRIEVKSQLQKGSTFTIVLPR